MNISSISVDDGKVSFTIEIDGVEYTTSAVVDFRLCEEKKAEVPFIQWIHNFYVGFRNCFTQRELNHIRQHINEHLNTA